jgi:hypothetical protein
MAAAIRSATMTQVVAMIGSSTTTHAGHAAGGDRDQGPVGGAEAALSTADGEREDEAREDGLGAGHDEAPRGAVGTL